MKCEKCHTEMEKRTHKIMTSVEELEQILSIKVQCDELYLFTCPRCHHRQVCVLDPDGASC